MPLAELPVRTYWTRTSTMKSSAVLEKPNSSDGASMDFAAKVIHYAGAAVRDAIAEHHRAGDAVPIWREGRIVLLHPDGSITEPEPSTS